MLRDIKEFELTFEEYTSLLKGDTIKYSKSLGIYRVKGSNCKGCCFNSTDKIGGCPFYRDPKGDTRYPCIVMGCIFKKVHIS